MFSKTKNLKNDLDETSVQAAVRELAAECEYRKRYSPLDFHVPLPMQDRFAKDPARLKCLFGGNRAAKTEGVADYIFRRIKASPKKLKIWICGETYQDSVDIQQKKIWELLPKREIKYGSYDEINGFTNRKLLLKNGTFFIFKSYDQRREAYQSDSVDLIWNDEEPPVDIFKEQKMRLLDRNGEMIISMTSLKGITDLIEDIFDGYDILESQYAPLVDRVLPRVAEKGNARFYFLWTTENPYIDQSAVAEEIKLMTPEEILCRIYGVPINLSGKIYITFSRRVHVLMDESLMPEGDYTLYHVLDPHDRKPWAMIWIAVHKTGTAYQVDEYPNKNFNEMLYDDKTYEDYVQVIKDKERYICELFGVDEVYRRIIDPNFGNKPVQLAKRQGGSASTTPKKELSSRGMYFHDAIDALEAGHLAVRQALHWAEKDGQIIVQPNYIILERCYNSIRHMSRYSRKDIESGDGDVKDNVKPMEKYKDFPDCIRYGIMSGLRYIPRQQKKEETGRIY